MLTTPAWIDHIISADFVQLIIMRFLQAGLHKLELNPYWKDGGSGLPSEEMAETAGKKGTTLLKSFY